VSARTILLVFRKELLDVVRDRRAVLLMLVLPIVFYPLLIVGFHYAMLIQLQVLEKKTAKVWVAPLAELPRGLRSELEKPDHHLELEDEPRGADEEEALASSEVRVVLRLPPDLEGEIARVTTAVPLEIVYNGGLDPSLEARRKVADAIGSWRHELVAERLRGRGVDPAILEPVVARHHDLAPKGAILGRVLGMILVLTSLMGAFYPAMDLGAGEKERGTLETLLLAPAQRTEIAAGKFLAVAAVALASAFVNLTSFGVTFSHFMSLASPGEISGRIGMVAITWGAVIPMAIAIVPLVALFSALSLAIATLATSYKEATSYLQPVAILASLLSVVSALPGVELTRDVALIPVASVSLLFKELLGGTATSGQVALVVGSNFVYALIALRWVAHLYSQEGVLARPAAALGIGLVRRRRPDERERVPTAAQAVAAAILALVLLWFGGEELQRGPHVVEGLAATLVLLIGAPPLLATAWFRLDARETYKLRPPPVRALAAAVLIALGTPVLLRDLTILQTAVTGEPLPQLEEAWGQFLAQLMAHGKLVALLVLALLPALCEELLFRGFILTGLRSGTTAFKAALVSALLFALVHLDPTRLGATATLGFVLAVVVIRSASLAPAMLCHFVHNGLVLAMSVRAPALEAQGLLHEGGRPGWTLRLAAAASAGVGLVLLRGVKPLGSLGT
jgi:sodium transport system permease protein